MTSDLLLIPTTRYTYCVDTAVKAVNKQSGLLYLVAFTAQAHLSLSTIAQAHPEPAVDIVSIAMCILVEILKTNSTSHVGCAGVGCRV